jgi:hypothetical protein
VWGVVCRWQVRVIVERLARRCGFDAVAAAIPEADRRLLIHIRKERSKKERRLSEAASQARPPAAVFRASQPRPGYALQHVAQQRRRAPPVRGLIPTALVIAGKPVGRPMHWMEVLCRGPCVVSPHATSVQLWWAWWRGKLGFLSLLKGLGSVGLGFVCTRPGM